MPGYGTYSMSSIFGQQHLICYRAERNKNLH